MSGLRGVHNGSVRTFEGISSYRTWRDESIRQRQTVGFVPTMGALHQGHLSLVDASLAENDMTIVSIFVNPAQFAPHEDLSSYPRTIESDLAQLNERQEKANASGRLAVLLPTVRDMYPHGFTQEISKQVGAFVEVKGLSHQMEGTTRPTFFRGVATVVTKLFNIVMQAIVLRRLADDLLFRYPQGHENVRVLPTSRDPTDMLALSSRNAYLDARGRAAAPTLYEALARGQMVWNKLLEQQVSPAERIQATLAAVREVVDRRAAGLASAPSDDGIRAHVKLDYVCLNDPNTLEELVDDANEGAILSGALWMYNDARQEKPTTRLIDNMLLGFSMDS
ncbi:hypothetical protein CBS9595_001029 [Malassezia furfur]|nr:hypothetical protein CBS9595_001029 [Malassezia furfur]